MRQKLFNAIVVLLVIGVCWAVSADFDTYTKQMEHKTGLTALVNMLNENTANASYSACKIETRLFQNLCNGQVITFGESGAAYSVRPNVHVTYRSNSGTIVGHAYAYDTTVSGFTVNCCAGAAVDATVIGTRP